MSGGGLLVAGLAVAAWFGYSFKDEIVDKTKGTVNTATEILAPIILGKSVAQMAENVSEVIGQPYLELIEKGKQLRREATKYCTTTSQYYDAQECARVDAEIQILNQELAGARAAMFASVRDETAKEVRSSVFWGIATLPNRF